MRLLPLLLPSALAIALSACTSTPSGSAGDAATPPPKPAPATPAPAKPSDMSGHRMLADGATATLRQGEAVMLADGGTLRYTGVSDDSRCRPDVQCIRAGEAYVGFSWTTASGSVSSFRVQTPDRTSYSHDVGARRVTVTGLDFAEPPVVTIRVDKR